MFRHSSRAEGQALSLPTRARPLLGTLVIIRGGTLAASDDAFAAIAHVDRCMSAHRADSDLARIARAAPGQTLMLDPHTVAVLRLAQYWHRASIGAFDPVRAARRLTLLGMRPGFDGVRVAPEARLSDLQVLGDRSVRLAKPLLLDLGGIAKGYAVDLAIARLQHHGVHDALVNAGGDLRACGDGHWPVALRDPARPGRIGATRRLRTIRDQALATSSRAGNAEFVATARRCTGAGNNAGAGWSGWAGCTVRARDCVTADALTKWGLQCGPMPGGEPQPRMKRLLRAHHATLWCY